MLTKLICNIDFDRLTPKCIVALVVNNFKNYAYYVEVPRILISRSNIHFILPIEFLEFFQFFCISTFRTLVTICANIHTYNLVLP